jgi:hypothetical protein
VLISTNNKKAEKHTKMENKQKKNIISGKTTLL